MAIIFSNGCEASDQRPRIVETTTTREVTRVVNVPKVVTREVDITREVEVIRVVTREVTKEVDSLRVVTRVVDVLIEDTKEIEVTREVEEAVEVELPIEVEVTREIEVPVEVTQLVEVPVEIEMTREIEATSEVEIEVTRESELVVTATSVPAPVEANGRSRTNPLPTDSQSSDAQESSPDDAEGSVVSGEAQNAVSSDPSERGKAIADFWWRNVWEAYPDIIFTPKEPRQLAPARDWTGELTLQYFDGTHFEPHEVWVGKSSGRWYQREFLPQLVDQLNSYYFFTESEEFQRPGAQKFMLSDLNVMFSIFKEYAEGNERYAWTPPMLGNMTWVHTVGWIEHDPDSPNCEDWVASIGNAYGENVENVCYQGSVFVLDGKSGDLISVQGNAVYAVDHTKYIPDSGPGYRNRDEYVYE